MRWETRGKKAFIPLLSGEAGELPWKLRLKEPLSIWTWMPSSFREKWFCKLYKGQDRTGNPDGRVSLGGRKKKKVSSCEGKGKKKKTDIYRCFSWPIPKCPIWTELKMSLNSPPPDGQTSDRWDREHGLSEATLGGKLRTTPASRASPLTCPRKTRPCAQVRRWHLLASESMLLPSRSSPRKQHRSENAFKHHHSPMPPLNTSSKHWPVLPPLYQNCESPPTILKSPAHRLPPFSGKLRYKSPGPGDLFTWAFL